MPLVLFALLLDVLPLLDPLPALDALVFDESPVSNAEVVAVAVLAAALAAS